MARIVLICLLLAPALARAGETDAPPRLGFGLALGLHPSPRAICQSNGDLYGCGGGWLMAWGLRLHAGYALAPHWSVDLVGGAGTDLDATEFGSAIGTSDYLRRFYDLALRGRYLLGGARGPAWLAVEAGLMVGVDSMTDFDRAGHTVHEASVSQLAPMAGLGVGVALLHHRDFTLEVEAGWRRTAFPQSPPMLPDTAARASTYGTRTWLWLGLGGRYGG